MPDYEKLYHLLFNAITDAVEHLGACRTELARERLIRAQQAAEDLYLAAEDE